MWAYNKHEYGDDVAILLLDLSYLCAEAVPDNFFPYTIHDL